MSDAPKPATPAPNFDRLAGPYRWMEWFSFGPQLARTRATYLPTLGEARNALVLGDGDGRFTASLLACNPRVKVHAVDLSRTMLNALERGAVLHRDRLRTQCADLRSWQPPAELAAEPRFDLIVTHFFLDCLSTEEVFALALKLRAVCTPDARWVVSDFAVPQTVAGRLLAGPLVAGLYLGFGILTGLATRRLPHHCSALRRAGFARLEQRKRLGGLLIAELWQAFED